MAKKKTGQAAKKAKNAAHYRKLYRQAAKKGLVKSGKPKNFTPSKYMRARLRELEPYLGSDYKAVTASPELKAVWKDAPSEIVPLTFNRKLIVKAPADAKVSTKGGVLSIRRHLGTGEFEQLPLPVTASNLKEFREWIVSNKYYNDILKHRDEVFNFRIYGNDSYGSFGDLESLLDELEKYDNFADQDWENSEDFFGHFELFRSFRDWSTSEHARNKRKHDRDRRDERKRKALARMSPEERERHLERKREYRAARRAKQKGYQRELEKRKEARKNETPEAREKRLAKQRATMQRSRERARAKRE